MKILKPESQRHVEYALHAPLFLTQGMGISQQFMLKLPSVFSIWVNKEGIEISLGMYMGQTGPAAMKPLDPYMHIVMVTR